MEKKLKNILMPVFLAIFVFSSVMLLRQWRDNRGGEATYENAASIAAGSTKTEKPEEAVLQTLPPETQPRESYWAVAPVADDPVMEEMAKIDLAALREVNPDVLGWIRIPDTKIDYPLMQGADNDFYLNHTWEKTPNSVGSIFLEHQNSAGLTDYNTIIYGHNMNNGSMFAGLQNYAVPDYWKDHPYVYVLTDAGVYRYEVFVFFRAEVDSLTYGLNPQRNDTKEDFLRLSLENSWIDTGIEPALTDRILTLSTCSGSNYDYRYVVQARLPMIRVEG